MFDGRPERGLLMTVPLVVETIEERKTNTRRIGSRYRGWRKGDLVYVRETFKPRVLNAEIVGARRPGIQYRDFSFRPCSWANGYGGGWYQWPRSETGDARPERWTPGIHMPKWAARVWLELTEDVVYEPLHSMTTEDFAAEGIQVPSFAVPTARGVELALRVEFASLWDTINGKRGPEDDPGRYLWGRNPEVAVIRYRLLSSTGRPA